MSAILADGFGFANWNGWLVRKAPAFNAGATPFVTS